MQTRRPLTGMKSVRHVQTFHRDQGNFGAQAKEIKITPK